MAPLSEQVKAAARAAADRGLELFEQESYAKALASFLEAEQHVHAPTFVIMIARTYDRLGRLLDARRAYQQILGEKLAYYAPAEFFDAQKEAQRELAALLPRIPTAQVAVNGVPAEKVSLTIDGIAAAIAQQVPLDPGEHTVSASAPGHAPEKRVLTLREGEAARVVIDLAPASFAAAPVPAPPLISTTAQPPDAPPAARGFVVPSIVAFGVAGVALGVGAVTGAMSLGHVDTLETACPSLNCYDDAADTYDAAHTLAAVSTVSFVLSGAATAAGVTLLLWPQGNREQPRSASLVIAPGSLSVQGSF